MAKCPECNKEIEFMRYTMGAYTSGNFFEDGYYEEKHSDQDTAVYYCPECNAELFDDEAEAMSFIGR